MTPVEALQRTLAAEHAAVYVYGVLGGRTSRSSSPQLWDRVDTAYRLHRARRDELLAMVRTAGAQPVAAEISYDLPRPADSVRNITHDALETERRCCAVYADMVGGTALANRQWAIDAMTDAAVRQLGFRGRPESFPGLTEI